MATATASPGPVPLDTIPVSPPDAMRDKTNETSDGDEKNGVDSGEPITVFHDAENFNVKHPLMNTWTLWFTKPSTGKVSESSSRGPPSGESMVAYLVSLGMWSCYIYTRDAAQLPAALLALAYLLGSVLPMLTNSKGDNWNDLLKEVIDFDSVEMFWGVYVRSPAPD